MVYPCRFSTRKTVDISSLLLLRIRGSIESRFCAFWYEVSDYAGFASAKPHRIRLFSGLFVHADRRCPRPFAGAVGTLFENAKLIFPFRAVETASAAIFITSGTAGPETVKSRLLLHEHFKRPFFPTHEIHSGYTSFFCGHKKTPQTFQSAAWLYAERGAILR